MHKLTPRAVVWLTDVHMRDTSTNGEVIEIRRNAGAVDWCPVQEHSGENLNDQPLEFIAIVPKSTGQPYRDMTAVIESAFGDNDNEPEAFEWRAAARSNIYRAANVSRVDTRTVIGLRPLLAESGIPD